MGLLNKKSYAPLTEGSYQIKLVSFEEAKSNNFEFVKFEAVSTKDGRPIKFNQFETGLNIMAAQLRQQLLPANDETVMDLTDLLTMAKESEVTMYVQYATVDGQTYRNILFAKPQTTEVDTTRPTVDQEEAF